MIIQHLDDEELPADAVNAIVWMPAHRSRTAIGTAMKSNGEYVTEKDWRANRLVDLLAKAAAFRHRVPEDLRLLLANAVAAVTFHAAMAGVTSHASNNSPSYALAEDGTTVTTMTRDAMPPLPRLGAWGPRCGGGPSARADAQPVATCHAPKATPADEPGHNTATSGAGQAGARARGRRRAAEEAERKEARFLDGWLRERAAQVHVALPNAQSRLEAVRERIRARAC